MPATPTPVGAACTVNSRNPLQRRRAISMLLSPPDERDKMRTHPNCHNCHRLSPTRTAKTPTRTAKAPTRTAKTPCAARQKHQHARQKRQHARQKHRRARQKHRRAAARSAASKPSARLAALRSSTNHARAHARTEAGRAHSGGSTPGLPHPARVGFVTAATLNAATHGPALAERSPNAARCHDFARADSARASRARQRRARQRRARQ